MKISPAALDGVLLIEPTVFGDERGFFYESFNAREFERLTGLRPDFVQDNHSRSGPGVLRGLHYQVIQPQEKLVRVSAGEILDVVVDLRRGSPTFGRSQQMVLSAANKLQLWVPAGFAHGFLVLGEQAEVQYKTTAYWEPRHERCIRWDDPTLAISWPLTAPPVLSGKDARGAALADAEVFP